ncbi:MAG: diacylglycerol kinase family protein [Candidatus Saccharibacteria bacterium]|nr:diacylglycerol kinase family protein [Candidatus Saccharibacteria bacterium]
MKFKVPAKVLSPARLRKSFGYAINGLQILTSEEQNYIVHLIATAIVIILGFYYRISGLEWTMVILSIQIVLALETINTAIENTVDFVSQERSEIIKRIKDLSAASVLMAAMAALIIGLIIFLPKIFPN